MKVTDIRLLSCIFRQNKNYKGTGEVEMATNIRFGADFDEATKVATGIIAVVIPENECYPYSFEIEVGGKFSLEDDEIPHIERICGINIPAILFPYLRENVADITRRSGNSPVHLGTINFVEIAKQKKLSVSAPPGITKHPYPNQA
ncbi:MAG: protein-export chaperone SecB [Desulfomicrobium sp.]|nr:protein-export chaperone SecB [Desulfomicrobium sp.]